MPSSIVSWNCVLDLIPQSFLNVTLLMRSGQKNQLNWIPVDSGVLWWQKQYTGSTSLLALFPRTWVRPRDREYGKSSSMLNCWNNSLSHGQPNCLKPKGHEIQKANIKRLQTSPQPPKYHCCSDLLQSIMDYVGLAGFVSTWTWRCAPPGKVHVLLSINRKFCPVVSSN